MLTHYTKAQSNIKHLIIYVYQNEESECINIITKKGVDSAETKQIVNRTIDEYRKEGYLLSRSKELKWRNDSVISKIYISEKYRWAYLNTGNLEQYYLNYIGYSTKSFSNTKFDFESLIMLERKVVEYAQNHGYPFASIKLDSVKVEENQIYAKINFVSGPLIEIDSISIVGNAHIKNKYLAKYLDFEKGKKFCQQNILRINQKLKGLSYIKLKKEPILKFYNGKAYLILYLNHVPANRFNGILGILPSTDVNKKIFITGELNLDIRNPFGSGKIIKVDWQKTQPQSQQLSMFYSHPNLFSTGLNSTFNFQILKQDSAFINVTRKITINKLLGIESYGFVSSLKTSRVLSNVKYDSLSSTPPYYDFNFWSYGMEYEINNLDNPLFPKRGFNLVLNSSIGIKSILKNNNIDAIHYNDLNLRSTQLFLNATSNKFIRLGKQSVLALAGKGGLLVNKNLFLNDMFRIGGISSLRGFNENNFFASQFLILTTEYRLFIDNNSFMSLFYDQSYIGIKTDQLKSEYPFGIGAGISFATNNGIFNFIYSLGHSSTQKLSFNLSRIHFGLVSKF